MKIKDWLLLFIPIVCNGIFIYIFQKIITFNLIKLEKKSKIRDEVFMQFWKRLQNLNEFIIQANITTKKNPNALSNELLKIQESILGIDIFYDTNKYDLRSFSKEYTCWKSSWNTFASTITKYNNSILTHEQQLLLGSQIQDVKDKTQYLIDIVRKNY